MSRTQMRLQQLTGSAVDLKSEVAQYITPVAAANLTGSDLQDLFGALGAAVQRIHGRASNEVFEQVEGRFDTSTVDFNTSTFDVDATGAFTVDAAGTSNVTTNGALTISGSTALNLASHGGEIDITAAQGLIDINATAGSIDIDAGDNVTIDAADLITLTTADTGADGKISLVSAAAGTNVAIHLDGNAAAGSIVDIDAGVLDIDAAGLVSIDAGGVVSIDAVGASNLTTNGALTISGSTGLNLASHGGEIDITATQGAIDINATAGGIDIDAGAASAFNTSAGKITIAGAGGEDIGTSGQTTTIKGEFNVDEAASFDSTVTITGDLTVLGSATEISSSNTIIKDALIVLNSSSYGDGTPIEQDAGIIFAQPDVSRALFVDTSESGDPFRFVTTYTSGSATSVTRLDDADVTLGGLTATSITLGSTLTNNRVVIVGTGGVLEDDSNFTFDGSDLALGANIGLTFDANGTEKIESDDTDLTISSGAKINLTATSDVHVPANVGLVFGDGEKIEGDDTDLTISSGAKINLTATSDVHVPANVGLVFGDGEKIEGDDTDLTVSSGAKINLTATSDVVIPANVGLVLDGTGAEKIESDGTDISISVGAGGDINIPSAIGLTFGDDGEKIEGDGTDLTIASSNKLNLTATTDVHIPQGVGLIFDTAGTEKIESDGTDLTIASANDVKIDLTTATSDSLQLLGNSSNENLILTPDNGSAQSVVSSSVGDLLLGANANIFLFQGAQQQSDLQISIPASDGDGVQFTTGDGEMIAISGSAGIFFSEDNIVASNYTGTSGFMALGASVAEYNSFVTNFDATKSIIGAINANASSLAAADKAILKVDAGGSVTSGSQIALNGGHSSMSALLSTDGVSVAGVSSPILKVEVYVNGQLLLSGSDANVGSGDADYLFDTDTSVKFGFGLEADDIVQVVRR